MYVVSSCFNSSPFLDDPICQPFYIVLLIDFHVAPSVQICLSVVFALSWKGMRYNHTHLGSIRLYNKANLCHVQMGFIMIFTNKDDFNMYECRVILKICIMY